MTDGGGWCWNRAHFSFSDWLLGVHATVTIRTSQVVGFFGEWGSKHGRSRKQGWLGCIISNSQILNSTYSYVCMYELYVESPQNRWVNDSARLLSSLSITSIARNKFNLIGLLAKRGTHENPQMTQAIPKLSVVLQKLMIVPCFCRQHLHNSLNMEKSS